MMANYTQRLGNGETVTAPFSTVFGVPSGREYSHRQKTRRAEVAKAFNIDLVSWNYPTTQPAKVEHRRGILSHPAWLIAFAGNTATIRSDAANGSAKSFSPARSPMSP